MIEINPGDVVQLDPASSLGQMYGPQFVIVHELKSFGFQGYFVHVTGRGEFGAAYLRVSHGEYKHVGRAEWELGR